MKRLSYLWMKGHAMLWLLLGRSDRAMHVFACMVRRGQWLWISQADEDAAVAAIRKFEAEWE